jgi:hypothetical protein
MRRLDDSDGAELVVNQLVGTYCIYQFRHGKVEHIRELKTGWTSFTLMEAKQVQFGELDDTVVASSDHGTIYVYRRISGSLLCKLRGFPSGSIPVIAVSFSTSNRVDFAQCTYHRQGPATNTSMSWLAVWSEAEAIKLSYGRCFGREHRLRNWQRHLHRSPILLSAANQH